VVVLRPSHDREKGRRAKERQQAPEVDRAKPRMSPAPFVGQHRACPRDDARDPERDVNRDDDGKENRIARRNRNAAKDGRSCIHSGALRIMRLLLALLARNWCARRDRVGGQPLGIRV